MWVTMKTCTKCKQTKDFREFAKLGKARDGLQYKCRECHGRYRKENKESISDHKKKTYLLNKEKILAHRKRYYADNRQKISGRNSEYYKKKKEEITAYKAQWYKENKDRLNTKQAWHTYRAKNLEKIRAKNRIYKRQNLWIGCAQSSKRRAIKLQATPKWLTEEHLKQIRDTYIRCANLTKQTGIKHQVDHIVPLLGKNVRGLHVPWNLQILTAHENGVKHSKYPILTNT